MEKIGVIFLGIGTMFAIWSAFMPSVMTITKFGLREGTDEDKRALLIAGVIALVICLFVVYGIWILYFKKKR